MYGHVFNSWWRWRWIVGKRLTVKVVSGHYVGLCTRPFLCRSLLCCKTEECLLEHPWQHTVQHHEDHITKRCLWSVGQQIQNAQMANHVSLGNQLKCTASDHCYAEISSYGKTQAVCLVAQHCAKRSPPYYSKQCRVFSQVQSAALFWSWWVVCRLGLLLLAPPSSSS